MLITSHIPEAQGRLEPSACWVFGSPLGVGSYQAYDKGAGAEGIWETPKIRGPYMYPKIVGLLL